MKVARCSGIHDELGSGCLCTRNLSSLHLDIAFMSNSNGGHPLADHRLGAPSIVHARNVLKDRNVEQDMPTIGDVALETPWSRRIRRDGEVDFAVIGIVDGNIEKDLSVDLMKVRGKQVKSRESMPRT